MKKVRRIIALIGIILLLAMYGSTMVFALMGSPNSKGFLMASIACTIFVPILLYAMSVVAKNVRGAGVDQPEEIRSAENAAPEEPVPPEAPEEESPSEEGSDDDSN